VESPALKIYYPSWVKLVRQYDTPTQTSTITGWVSPDGTQWTQVGETVTMTTLSAMYVGVVASSETAAAVASGTLDEVTASDTGDFYLAALHTTRTLPTTGGMAHYPLVLNAMNGFTGTVSVSANTLPTGTTVSISPTSPGVFEASDVALTLGSGATSGTSWFKVSGSSGSLVHGLDLALTASTPGSGALPAAWANKDIGGSFSGTGATYSGGAFTVTGASPSGQGIGGFIGTLDEFQFVYQPIIGNATLIARLTSTPAGGGAPRVGILLRTSLSGTAAYAAMLLNDTALTAVFRQRSTIADWSSDSTGSAIGTPGWLKLVRQFNATNQTSTVTGYVSTNGSAWTQVGTVTLATSAPVYVGLLSTTTSTSSTMTATFDNVSVGP